ncbi:MAG TPA: trehalose-phosphatase [Stellaceae bacterium]|nr:trehalose-phosphatase [Stellaceae bacterium]
MVSQHDTAPAEIPPPALQRSHALFLDFDGTLVEIAARPGLVRVSPELRRLLGQVASLLDGAAAIVSGRPVDELSRLLARFPGVLVGQHGLERRRTDGRVVRWSAEPALKPIRAVLAKFAQTHKGVELEDKGVTLALHFRLAPRFAAECIELVRRLADASGGALEAIDGKMVVELVPEGSGKGGAIAALLAEPPFIGRVPIFIGDDSADEEGFVVIDRLGGTSVHVGDGVSSARHRLGSVAQVRAWLAQSLAR